MFSCHVFLSQYQAQARTFTLIAECVLACKLRVIYLTDLIGNTKNDDANTNTMAAINSDE